MPWRGALCTTTGMLTWSLTPLSLFPGKAQRLKAAKQEAEAEIKAFADQSDKQFKAKEAAHDGASDDAFVRITNEKNTKIKQLDESVTQNKAEVCIACVDHALACRILPPLARTIDSSAFIAGCPLTHLTLCAARR